MMQKPWFKLFIWLAASAFFFMAAALLISFFNPPPDAEEQMAFMSGMMDAMHNSLMGLSMSLEGEGALKVFIGEIAALTVPLIMIAVAGGILIRLKGAKS